MKNLRIIFMGTPEFAVATLGALLMNGFNVVGVVTAPDKPAGRGRRLSKPRVKEFAEESYLPVWQPEDLNNPEFEASLQSLKPDLIIVVAFRKIPSIIWKIPALGTFNLHASLLPHYRGAAPVNHAIINGETITGVTTFMIDDNIDTGNILLREEVHIMPNENAGDLKTRLMKAGARLVIKTIEGLASGTLKPVPQSTFLKPGEIPKTAPKIFPQDCFIDWTKDNVSINNLVRGLAPDPGARTFLKRKNEYHVLKIFESLPAESQEYLKPGAIITDNRNTLTVACGKGVLKIITLQLEGRKKMSVSEFLRGISLKECEITANKPV